MKHRSLLGAALLAATVMAGYAETAQIDLMPDTWVAIDGLDRVLPTAAEQPLRQDKDRTVGIFYVSWHYDFFHSQFKQPYASDVTKILEQDPSARLDYYHPLWLHEFAYHWGEPELGYFTSGDEYVVRKDISMLTDAGVDVLILDCTNAVTYFDAWNVLFRTLTAMKAEGNVVPKVCFWGYNNEVAARLKDIYDYYYARGLYSDLWFYWDGKPLMLYNENASYPQEIYDFFTLRHMWWGYYAVDGKRYLGTEDHWSFGMDMHDPHVSELSVKERVATHKGRPEQFAVTPAQHASTFVGKSWTLSAGEPTLNVYDLPGKKYVNRKWLTHPEYYGFYFKERWDEAMIADPDFLYINDWNEWIAGQFPGNCTFMGRNSNYQFVDQYNAEFNRTIQPMKGGGTDNYYMQMVDGIRRYKGVREAPIAKDRHAVSLSSDIEQWSKVEEKFLDTPGDVTHRNYTGYGGHRYENTSGRNDILVSKVNLGKDVVTFYVETADVLTPYTDPNWMLLLLNADCDFNTGWHGFDFLINKEFESDSRTAVMGWDKEKKEWTKIGAADFRVVGNRLVVEVPLDLLGVSDDVKGGFYFKWADNPADLTDPISLCINGDTAPNRRFCYNYRWDFSNSGLEDMMADDTRFTATALYGRGLSVDCDGDFTVTSMTGVTVAQGHGRSYLTLPAAGLYVVSSAGRSVKVAVQ